MRIPVIIVLALSVPVATASAAPAARIGDATSHGGAVVTGSPNVLIGGRGAARVNDTATCPQFVPGDPPVPHVGGPIVAGSATVLINGRPAARLGDPIVEAAGPGSAVAGGAPTVVIGSGASRPAGRRAGRALRSP